MVRHACEAILNLQRLLEDRVGPVDILQVVAGRARGEQVRADLWQQSGRYRHEGARRRAGITKWPDNAVRHSFVSYRLAATQNAPQTAWSRAMTRPFYSSTTVDSLDRKDAERFFSIRPIAREVAEKIVSISAA
jgi:hypothetical protein